MQREGAILYQNWNIIIRQNTDLAAWFSLSWRPVVFFTPGLCHYGPVLSPCLYSQVIKLTMQLEFKLPKEWCSQSLSCTECPYQSFSPSLPIGWLLSGWLPLSLMPIPGLQVWPAGGITWMMHFDLCMKDCHSWWPRMRFMWQVLGIMFCSLLEKDVWLWLLNTLNNLRNQKFDLDSSLRGTQK